MFLSSTCCCVCLFIGFCGDDSNGNAASIRQRSHIKSMFIGMVLQTWNFKYCRHIMVISYASLEPFFLTFKLNVVSSLNIFSNLIYAFRYKCIAVLNQ